MLASTDVIDRQEVKDLVPFNHLRNSRADSGFSYWVNSGFEVDAENGVSGTASFKAEGESGMTKKPAGGFRKLGERSADMVCSQHHKPAEAGEKALKLGLLGRGKGAEAYPV